MSSWAPSDEQQHILGMVTDCMNRGLVLISEWVSATDLTWADWEIWWADKDFRLWWIERVPAHHGVTDADLRMVESLAMRTLARGLLEGGKDRASLISVWQRINESRKAAQEHGAVLNDDEEWLEYMGGNPEKNWLNGGSTVEA